jgi:microsomal dipeptidase-like Zn-dependent dipeptidase
MVAVNRRRFLQSLLMSYAGLVSSSGLGALLGCASRRAVPALQPVPRDPSRRVLADLHAHVLLEEWLDRSPLFVKSPASFGVATAVVNQTSIDLERCHGAGVNLICAAHYNPYDEWVSMPTDPTPDAPASTHLMMDLLEEKLNGEAAPFARLARNHEELHSLLDVLPPDERYRVAVVHAIEGGHALGGQLETLESFAQRGVAWMTITHFFNKGIASAANAFPFFPDMAAERPSQGLSPFGEEVVAEMERLGIIVDITHCTATALDDVLRVSTKPLLATHASARTLGDHPYSFHDEHIEEIVRRGGMIGVVLYPFLLSNYTGTDTAGKHGSLDDVVRTVRYVTKICGTHKHVGIGSDFSGFITAPRDMSHLSEIDNLRQLLLREFDGDETIVEDILANNAVDFLLANWRSGLS